MKVINKSKAEVVVLNDDFSTGIYIGCYFKVGSGTYRNDQIIQEVEMLKNLLSKKIPNLKWLDKEEDENGKHITIIYSKNKPNKDEIILENLPTTLEVHYASKLKVFPYNDNYSIVLPLEPIDDSEEYIELNKRFKEEYELEEYFDYLPHITIGVFGPELKEEVEEAISKLEIDKDNERSFNKVYYILDQANSK